MTQGLVMTNKGLIGPFSRCNEFVNEVYVESRLPSKIPDDHLADWNSSG